MLPSIVKKKLVHFPACIALSLGKKFSVDGFKVIVLLQDRQTAELLRAKVAAALTLIRTHTPRSYARSRKFIPNILIFGAHSYNATYVCDLKLCDLSRHYARSEKTTPARLAMTLVHEAAHGYLTSIGITYTEERRKRIEGICIRNEIAFARRLPDSASLIEQAQSKLSYEPEFWSNEAFFERDLELLKGSGAPKWLVTYLRTRRTKRTQLRVPPNGGPAQPSGSSGAGNGPPSVS